METTRSEGQGSRVAPQLVLGYYFFLALPEPSLWCQRAFFLTLPPAIHHHYTGGTEFHEGRSAFKTTQRPWDLKALGPGDPGS